MTEKEIDGQNLQDILKRIESLHSKKFKEEVRNIIGLYPKAERFVLKERATGAEKTHKGEKIKAFHESDEHVFIMILERKKEGQRKNAKDPKFDRSFLRFKHNVEVNETKTKGDS